MFCSSRHSWAGIMLVGTDISVNASLGLHTLNWPRARTFTKIAHTLYWARSYHLFVGQWPKGSPRISPSSAATRRYSNRYTRGIATCIVVVCKRHSHRACLPCTRALGVRSNCNLSLYGFGTPARNRRLTLIRAWFGLWSLVGVQAVVLFRA